MSHTVSFAVLGVPTPKGSFTRMPGGQMLPAGTNESRKRGVTWRQDVREAARVAMGEREPFTGAIRLMADFALTYPKSSVRKWQMGWYPPTKKPDVDKLLRSVCDHLTGIVWADDSQVCWVMLNKSYAWDHRSGVTLDVTELDEVSLRAYASSREQVQSALRALQ